MSEPGRRLAAIMFSDIAGYTSLMAQSEEAGLRVRQRHREVLAALAGRYGGEVVDENGDELVLAFASAFDAVNCALAAQGRIRDDPELRLRIGIHLGDVVFEGGRVYGDGVNVASRIRPLAVPGGVCVSEQVFDSVKNHRNVEARPLGEQTLKNVERPLPVYAVSGSAVSPLGSEAPARTPARRSSSWRLLAAGIALIGVALAGGWFALRSLPGAGSGPIRAIAVLPLDNLSGDAEQEYFADGMTEALIAELGKIRALHVTSRTSIMRYKETDKSLSEIANELGVEAVVEGSVLRSGGRVRITAQLIDARSDHHLWAEHYERALEDVLTLQGEVATAIAREVRVQLTPEEQSRLGAKQPVDPGVHDLYLRGRFAWNQRSPEGLRQAIRYFERAVEAEPSYARAWAGLADAHVLLPLYEGTDQRRATPQVRTTAERALAIDDSLAEAYTALALQSGFWDWEFERAEELFRRAIELDPSYPTAHQWYGDLLNGLGRSEEAIARLERARQLDPLSTAGLIDLGLAYATAGRYQDGVRTHREAIALDPEYPLAHTYLGVTYLAMEEAPSAAAAFEQAVAFSEGQPAYPLLLAVAYARMDRTAEARTILEGVLGQSEERHVPPLLLALVHRALGDDEEAFRFTERAFQNGDPWVLLLPISYLSELRADPRFQKLARRHGFPESFTRGPPNPTG